MLMFVAQGKGDRTGESAQGKGKKGRETLVDVDVCCSRKRRPDRRLGPSACVCMCVCVFSSHLFWTSSSLDIPAGVTQDFSSTFLLRCAP